MEHSHLGESRNSWNGNAHPYTPSRESIEKLPESNHPTDTTNYTHYSQYNRL